MILSTLIFLTVIGLIILLQSTIEGDDGIIILGTMILVFNLLFGWGVVGTSMDNSTIEVKQNPIEVLKGKHVGVLVFETKTFMVKDYDLEKVNDKSIFYYKIGYNIYNYITDTTLIIK